MFQDSALDRCIEDLSSTLELAEALEKQLEQVHRKAGRSLADPEAGESEPGSA